MEKKKVIASEVSKAGGQPEALSAAPASAEATPTRPRMAAAPGPSAVSGPMRSGLQPISSTNSTRRPVAPAPPPTVDSVEFPVDGEVLGLGMMLKAATSAPLSPNLSSSDQGEIDIIGNEVELEASTQPSQFEESDALSPVDQPTESAEPTQPSLLSNANAGPMSAGTLQKMKDQGFYRQQYFKDAQCFDCDHKFKVARSSRSANCPSCGAYIGMEDVELNMPSSQAIKTRGDVLIRKRGQLTATHLYCRELRCYGLVSANMFCSGDAIFRASGTIVGDIHCRRFVVEKGSEITFMNPVYAEEVEIQAPITGNVFSKGSLVISANGAVNGDVTARSVSIEPGGELNGSMNIVRTSPPPSATPAV